MRRPPARRDNLRREGVPEERILLSGNTVVDALQFIRDRLGRDEAFQRQAAQRFDFIDPARRLILVTGHRREASARGSSRSAPALAESTHRGDVQIVYPVHLNPQCPQAGV